MLNRLYTVYIQYKRFINDLLYIFRNFQIYLKNFGQSEWSTSIKFEWTAKFSISFTYNSRVVLSFILFFILIYLIWHFLLPSYILQTIVRFVKIYGH